MSQGNGGDHKARPARHYLERLDGAGRVRVSPRPEVVPTAGHGPRLHGPAPGLFPAPFVPRHKGGLLVDDSPVCRAAPDAYLEPLANRHSLLDATGQMEDVLGDLRSRRALGGFKEEMGEHYAVGGPVDGDGDRVLGACQGDEAPVLGVASVGPDKEGQAAQRQAPNAVFAVVAQQLHAGVTPPGQIERLVVGHRMLLGGLAGC